MAKIATVSMESDPRNKGANLAKMKAFACDAARQGADLVLFPEESLTGVGTEGMYMVCGEDKRYVHEVAERVPDGPSTQELMGLARDEGIYICWGMAERDADRFDVTYNTMVLVGPEGYVGKYRKVHLPLCERLLHYPGRDGYKVFDTSIGKVGVEICYDICFPEVARSLALQGAQVILSQTGWPNLTRKEDDPDHLVVDIFHRARANENMVVVVSSNLSGEGFNGCSAIYGPTAGQVFASTGPDESMVVADVDVVGEIERARTFSMGGSNLVKDRKPGTYRALSEDSPYCPEFGASVCS